MILIVVVIEWPKPDEPSGCLESLNAMFDN